MTPDPELTGLAIVVLVLVVILSTYWGKGHKAPKGPDVGVDILDEDITRPSLEVIDDALRHVGADNRGAQDWLLDRRLAAMERASNGA